QHAGATNLQQHFPAFDGIYIECRPLDRRRRRLEHRQEDYEAQHDGRRAGRIRPALAFAFLFQVVSDEVHLSVAAEYKSGRSIARCMPKAKPAKPRPPALLRELECPEMERPDRKWDWFDGAFTPFDSGGNLSAAGCILQPEHKLTSIQT